MHTSKKKKSEFYFCSNLDFKPAKSCRHHHPLIPHPGASSKPSLTIVGYWYLLDPSLSPLLDPDQGIQLAMHSSLWNFDGIWVFDAMAGVKQNPKDVTVIACPVSTGRAQPHLIHTLVHSQGYWVRAVWHHPLIGTSKRLPSVLYLTEFSDRVSSRSNGARQMPYEVSLVCRKTLRNMGKP